MLTILLIVSGCGLLHPETKLHTKILSSKNLNPDLNDRASPVLLTFYELKNGLRFKASSFMQLNDEAQKTLGSSLIDFNQIELRPSQTRTYSVQLNENTRYLGLVAAYRNLETAKWRQLIAIPNNTRKLKINIYLNSETVQYKMLD